MLRYRNTSGEGSSGSSPDYGKGNKYPNVEFSRIFDEDTDSDSDSEGYDAEKLLKSLKLEISEKVRIMEELIFGENFSISLLDFNNEKCLTELREVFNTLLQKKQYISKINSVDKIIQNLPEFISAFNLIKDILSSNLENVKDERLQSGLDEMLGSSHTSKEMMKGVIQDTEEYIGSFANYYNQYN